MTGAQPAGPGPFDVERKGIADMDDFRGGAIDGFECVSEDERRGLPGAGVGGRNDGLEKRGEVESAEDGMEPPVEVGDHRELEPRVARSMEELEGFGVDFPCLGPGVVVEKFLKGGIADGLVECGFNQRPPPPAFGLVAVVRGLKIGLVHGAEAGAEAALEVFGGVMDAVTSQKAGINGTDGLGEIDEGAGGIEEQGADHVTRMSGLGRDAS